MHVGFNDVQVQPASFRQGGIDHHRRGVVLHFTFAACTNVQLDHSQIDLHLFLAGQDRAGPLIVSGPSMRAVGAAVRLPFF